MAADQATISETVFQLPITGRRNGLDGVVVGRAMVADDDFTRDVLIRLRWNINNMGYAYRREPRPGRAVILLHRVVFEHYHGAIPEGLEIDHIDRDPLNNVPSNLRAVTHSFNMGNRRKSRRNTLGFVGINRQLTKHGWRWHAKMMVNRQRIHLGVYDTPEEAAEAVNRGFRTYRPGIQVPNLPK